MRFVLTLPIKAYQKYISPLFAPRCKYYPSCSTYTELAITEFGIKGLFMGIYRFVRCNPFSHGGVDYPSEQAILVVRERQMS
jgi:putative membrane protein insertion efficiency factor